MAGTETGSLVKHSTHTDKGKGKAKRESLGRKKKGHPESGEDDPFDVIDKEIGKSEIGTQCMLSLSTNGLL